MLAEDLGIGTTDDIFHFEETFPLVIERLKSSVSIGAMEIAALPLSILTEIPSGTEALFVFKPFIRLNISCSVHSISADSGDEGTAAKHSQSNSLKGGIVLLKF